MDILEFTRWGEVVLGVACTIFGVLRTALVWKELSRGQKCFFVASIAFLITATWDTYDLIIHDEEFTWRVLPFMVGLVSCFIYLMEPGRSWRRRLGREPFDPKEDGEL